MEELGFKLPNGNIKLDKLKRIFVADECGGKVPGFDEKIMALSLPARRQLPATPRHVTLWACCNLDRSTVLPPLFITPHKHYCGPTIFEKIEKKYPNALVCTKRFYYYYGY